MKAPGHYPPRKLSVPVFMAILFLIAIALPPCAESAPLKNIPVTLQQPDGTVLHLYASGDEYYNWLHDKAGYTIIQDPLTGFCVYAIKDYDGNLVASGHVVGTVDPQAIGLDKGIKDAPERIREKLEKKRASLRGALVEERKPIQAPNKGAIDNLIVFIRFSDQAEFTDSLNTYESMFNSEVSGSNSMYNYFREISYNQLNVSASFYPAAVGGIVRSYQDTHPRGYYRPYNAATNPLGYTNAEERLEREHTLLRNAVMGIASLVSSSLNLDADNDGNVDNVCFIVSGEPDAWNELLWPHMWNLSAKEAYINGKRVWGYNIQLQTAITAFGVGVLCHEMLHSIGFPDLYHHDPTLASLEPVSNWDIMENGLNPPQHPGAYTKYLYGNWIDAIPTITTPGTYTLNPITSSSQNAYRINSLYTPNEYFLVEYRKKTGTFEGNLPGEGLLVYRIDRTRMGQGNGSGPPDEVYIYRPLGTTISNGTPNKAPMSTDSGRRLITDTTFPKSFLADGSPGGLYLYNVSAVGDSISFSIAFPPFLPKTGQTTTYAPGDDGALQAGIDWPEPRFTVEGECITDHLTGLMWLRGDLAPPKTCDTFIGCWEQAITYANNLDLCGTKKWRIPNVFELRTLSNASAKDMSIWLKAEGFTRVGGNVNYYWSSTTMPNNPFPFADVLFEGSIIDSAEAINFTPFSLLPVSGPREDGAYIVPKTGQIKIRHGGDDGYHQAGGNWPYPRFKTIYCTWNEPCADQSSDCDGMYINDMVLDYLTGLYWARDANPASPNRKQWSAAVGWANGWSGPCGLSDWKLPNLLELQSLLDYSKDPAIDISLFFDVQYWYYDRCLARYWSSTTAPMDYQMPGCLPNNSAGTVEFGKGQHYLGYLAIKDGLDLDSCFQKCANYVWPVRAAQPVSPKPLLYVWKSGAGSGTVSSTPAGIDCGSACYGLYPTGELVTLSAQPAAGSEFNSWKGCDSVAGTICTVTMNDDRMITAVFTSPSYTLTIKKAGKGSGTVTSDPAGISCGSNCSDSYQGGTVVKLTAASSSNSIFTGWSGGGCSGKGTCTVTVSADTTVTATFVPTFTLTVSKAGGGTGKVTSDPKGIDCGVDCAFDFVSGVKATLTAIPGSGSVFDGWTGCDKISGDTCTVTMVIKKFVTAAFKPTGDSRTLTVTKSGTGSGTVTSTPAGIDCGTDCSEPYSLNSQVTLLAAPAPGSAFTGWSGGGCSGTGTCKVTMNAETTVNAAFSSPCGIAMTLPNGGEIWQAGLKKNLAWTYTGDSGSTVEIKLLKGASTQLTQQVPIGSNGTGSYNLMLPKTLTPGKNYRIRATAINSATGLCSDESDGDFTILPPLVVTYPNGGEELIQNEKYNITWGYVGNPGAEVKVELLKSGKVSAVLGENVAAGSGGQGSFQWTVAKETPPDGAYRIRVSSTTSKYNLDSSDSDFSIAVPVLKISITSPNGGETWMANSTQTIQWTYTGNPGTGVKIQLLKEGKLDRVIATNAPPGTGGKGSFSWKIPAGIPSAADYKIRIKSITQADVSDSSDSNFTISVPLVTSIKLTSPNGGESWGAGHSQIITWTYTGDPGSKVKIELLKSGKLDRTITTTASIGVGGSGSYPWDIPLKLAAGTAYKIKIMSTSNNEWTDNSDKNFTITVPPTISLVSPNGGESLQRGTPHMISWTYTGDAGDAVRIEVLKGGNTERLLAPEAPIGNAGNGSFEWGMALDQPTGNDYKIKVTSTADPLCQDTSDGAFSVVAISPLPNLTPYQPAGWADKIVLSYTPGTHDDDRPIWPEDVIYVDWAVVNNGTATASGLVRFDLYVDGIMEGTWSENYNSWTPNTYVHLDDFSVGPFKAGTHTISLVIDPLNKIEESNESDNEYVRTFIVVKP
jgi:M6 family metalloprotease-like protein